MQVIWEVDDIKPGRIVQRPGKGLIGRYMIGWQSTPRLRSESGEMNVYGLVSLADGMWIDIGKGTKDAVATHMNNNPGAFMPYELVTE